jgi:hypothetical protein
VVTPLYTQIKNFIISNLSFMIKKIIANKRMEEIKICKNCWYYAHDPATDKILDDPESANKNHYCEFLNDLPSVNADDACENWESKKLKLISAIKSLYGL